jgi:hypothetical protein
MFLMKVTSPLSFSFLSNGSSYIDTQNPLSFLSSIFAIGPVFYLMLFCPFFKPALMLALTI